MKTLIIEDPSLAPLTKRIGWTFFTAIFWMVWIYLWMPLITLVLWWWGIHLFDHYFVHLPDEAIVNLKYLAMMYMLIIVALGGGLLGWATTEFIRFRDVNKRQHPPAVAPVEIANFMNVPTEKVIELTTTRTMVMHHDEHGHFLGVDVG